MKSRVSQVHFIGLYTIVRREVYRFLRIWPQTLLPSVVSAVLYFIIFGDLMGARIGKIAGVEYMSYIVPGLIMMSIIKSSYSNVVSSFFLAKFQKSIEELLVSSLSNQSILFGFILGGMARGLLVGVLVSITALFFVDLPIQHPWIVCVVTIMTALLFSLAGFINAIFAKKFDDISIVPDFILTPLIYLGGIFYSVHLLPPFWQNITYANPLFYIVSAFRFGILGCADIDLSFTLSLLFVVNIVLYAISLWLLKRGIGIKN